MADGINYSGDLPRYVLDRLFNNLTDKSYRNVYDWNNVDTLWIITRESKSKFQLTIWVFSIVFVMSVIEKLTEFLNTLPMKYELQNKCWINTVVMIQSVPYLCWLFYFQNIMITFLFKKINLCCWNLDLKWRNLFSYKEYGAQWSQRSRPVVLKWLSQRLN